MVKLYHMVKLMLSNAQSVGTLRAARVTSRTPQHNTQPEKPGPAVAAAQHNTRQQPEETEPAVAAGQSQEAGLQRLAQHRRSRSHKPCT